MDSIGSYFTSLWILTFRVFFFSSHSSSSCCTSLHEQVRPERSQSSQDGMPRIQWHLYQRQKGGIFTPTAAPANSCMHSKASVALDLPLYLLGWHRQNCHQRHHHGQRHQSSPSLCFSSLPHKLIYASMTCLQIKLEEIRSLVVQRQSEFALISYLCGAAASRTKEITGESSRLCMHDAASSNRNRLFN